MGPESFSMMEVSSIFRAIARETVAIIDADGYQSPSGRAVRLGDDIDAAVAGTRLYLPDEKVTVPQAGGSGVPVVEVTNETSLSASRRLSAVAQDAGTWGAGTWGAEARGVEARDAGAQGDGVGCLVFASAHKPGGGFLNGAQAQEETIARASALYASLSAVPEFYSFHREHRDLLYSDRVIYSPGVPVFRDDDETLLDEPYRVSFLTAAAPNLGAIMVDQPASAARISSVLDARARRVLEVAAANGHRTLVLGAWGCGVFRNDPASVAAIFAGHLRRVPGWFDRVVFAVLDRQPGAPTYSAFARELG
jgi:uncharacterized protein (TIGR02452 family)